MKKNYLYQKTVVISGASGGLGFSIAKSLIEKYDCKIIGIARNEKKILNSIESLGCKKDNFSYKLFDVSKRENWTEFYDYLKNIFDTSTKEVEEKDKTQEANLQAMARSEIAREDGYFKTYGKLYGIK